MTIVTKSNFRSDEPFWIDINVIICGIAINPIYKLTKNFFMVGSHYLILARFVFVEKDLIVLECMYSRCEWNRNRIL